MLFALLSLSNDLIKPGIIVLMGAWRQVPQLKTLNTLGLTTFRGVAWFHENKEKVR